MLLGHFNSFNDLALGFTAVEQSRSGQPRPLNLQYLMETRSAAQLMPIPQVYFL
jgi:hypothetical protein